MSTYGGESVYFYISGSHTGSSVSPIANYTNCPSGPGSLLGCTSYPATTCSLGNTTGVGGTPAYIRCTTWPGMGSGMTWHVSWDSVPIFSTLALRTSYTPPVIYNMTNNAQLNTSGGTIVTINGNFFGPFDSANSSTDLVFGVFEEFSCAVLPAIPGQNVQTTLRCAAGVGAGGGLPFQMYLGFQTPSSLSTIPSLSYAPPAIYTVSVSPTLIEPLGGNGTLSIGRLPTGGGTPLYISGANFGPANDPLGFGIGLTVSYGGTAGTLYPIICTRAAGAAAHTMLICTSASGVGTNLKVRAVVLTAVWMSACVCLSML